jgi:hypothetical protein
MAIIDHVHQRRGGLLIVGERLDQRGAAGLERVHAALHQRRGVDQQARRGRLLQIVILERAQAVAEPHQAPRQQRVDAGLALHDVLLQLRLGKSKRSATKRWRVLGFMPLSRFW